MIVLISPPLSFARDEMEFGTAYIWLDELSGMYRIRFPYDEHMIKWIRTSIPSGFRRWDKENKVWMVTPDYLKIVTEFLVAAGYEISYHGEAEATIKENAEKKSEVIQGILGISKKKIEV